MTREQRDKMIVKYVTVNGWTYTRVAKRYGITRQRAWQIVQESKA